MTNFEPNAIIRGAQLTLVGAHRALQNPKLFKAEIYRQAAIAVAAGIAIRLLIAVPILSIKSILWLLSFAIDFDRVTWDDKFINGLDYLATSVLQVPFFLMSLMRYITPTLDHMFMDSLAWVDQTYYQKHQSDDAAKLRATYHAELNLYQHGSDAGTAQRRKSPRDAIFAFLNRFGRRTTLMLLIYAFSFTPYIGRFILPAASFYTFNKAVGPVPAAVIFGTGIFLPRHYLASFLSAYFSSRSLMRELLEPYFSRIHFTKAQKKRWFRDREGVLFGFAIGFYTLLKIPLLGVLIYGVAEASTAYLVTKITDPPPPPQSARKELDTWIENQTTWRNKQEFLRLPLAKIDALNVVLGARGNVKDSM